MRSTTLTITSCLACLLSVSPSTADPSLNLDTRANIDTCQFDIATRDDGLAYSPPHYPSPWMNPEAPGWEESYLKAKEFVSQLTLLEKVNITTGVGYVVSLCHIHTHTQNETE